MSTSTTASDRGRRAAPAGRCATSTIRTAVTISTPASAASGIWATSAPPKNTTTTSTSACTIADDAGAGAGADVDRGAGDRAGRGHAAEQRRDEVGEALAEQLAVGVVAAGVGHAVGDLRRQQALDRGERGDGERRAEQLADAVRAGPTGSDGVGSESGSAPMRATSEPATSATTVATTTASSDAGSDRCSRGDQRSSRPRRARRVPSAARLPVAERRRAAARAGDGRGVLALGLGDAERGGHLLQEDDHGDADGEALDHRPRDVGEVADRAERTRRRRSSTPAMIPTTNTASAP